MSQTFTELNWAKNTAGTERQPVANTRHAAHFKQAVNIAQR